MWLETMTLLPWPGPVPDQPDRLAPATDRVHAGERLVEDEQFGIVHERLRELDALPHPLAVGADALARGVHQVHQVERALGRGAGLGLAVGR